MLIKKLSYSGAYKIFMWVAKALADKGHEVTVFTYMNSDVKELPHNIRWIQTNLEHAGMWKSVVEARRQMKKWDADVSISFLLDANIINTLACMGIKTKSVICERNDPFKPHYHKLKLTKALFRFADGAIFQLPKVAEYYSMVKGPTTIIPNPVPPASEKVDLRPFDERDNMIVSLGRLDIFQKRQDILIKAFARFLKKHPDYTLKLYGDGPDEGKLKVLTKKLNITDRVVFVGVTNHSLQVLSKAKFFVLSSDFEGISNALLEAMSIGLPCISTRCRPGGAEFLIKDGINGLLIPTGDVEALAEKMDYMVQNPTIANKMGNEARKITERLSSDVIIKMWNEYIEGLANI